MGLLDDAIREHLDLKRARGADPAEVERLEREALGPVRREPTIGAAHFEAPEHHDEHMHQPEELGYHDSTAPHSQSYLEHHAPRLDLAGGHAQSDGVRVEEDEEQPKRRFLRRSRPASPEPEAPGTFGHDELPDHLELPPHDDLLQHHDVSAHDDLLEHEVPLEHEPETEQHATAEPPHLQFNAPPARPRFTTEPPGARPPQDEEAPADLHEPQDAAPADAETAAEPQSHPPPDQPDAALHDEPATPHHEPQPTHEFDVPSSFHEGEGDGDVEDGEADEDDVLEETPEFLQDTPEHDRLWFEQRPPRDFDFDG